MTSPITTLFITPNDMKTVFTTLQLNVDVSLVTPNIQRAQQMMIEHKLGKTLSDKIKSELNANTLVDPYLTLLNEYIAPTLAYWSIYLTIPDLALKMTEKGILLQSSNNSTNGSLDEIAWLRADKRDSAEFYENRMINYLKDNPTLFPEYNPDTIKVNKGVYRAGILIPKNNKKYNGLY